MSEKERTPQANIAPFGLRMQPDLKAKIEEAARANERSMNAEIVARLIDSFNPEGLAEIRNQLIAMDRYTETLRKALAARGDAAEATDSIRKMYEEDVADLQDSLKKIAQVTRFVSSAFDDAAAGDLADLKWLVESIHPFQDYGIPRNPQALLDAQYEFGLMRLATDVPEDERPAAHSQLLEMISNSATLLGVTWTPPNRDSGEALSDKE